MMRPTTRPTSASVAPRTSSKYSNSTSMLFEHHGGAVGEQFGRALRDGRGGEAHVEHRVRAHGLRLLDHACEGLVARLLQELGVRLELAADDVLQAGKKVLADVLCPHGAPLHQAEVLHHPLAGDDLEVRQQHGASLCRCSYWPSPESTAWPQGVSWL